MRIMTNINDAAKVRQEHGCLMASHQALTPELTLATLLESAGTPVRLEGFTTDRDLGETERISRISHFFPPRRS